MCIATFILSAFTVVGTEAGPRMAVDGEALPAVATLPSPFVRPGESTNVIRSFSDAGIKLFSDLWTLNGKREWWIGEGEYDWALFDRLVWGLLKGNRDAYVMPRIKLDPPKKWIQAHPSEMSSSGVEVNPASLPWRAAYRRMLEDMIAHVGKSSYAKRIVGYHIGALHCGEWGDGKRPLSEFPAVDAKYANNPLAPVEATAARREYLRGRAKAAADALLDAAAIIKEKTCGKKIVCAFFGYGHSIEQEDLMRVVRSGMVDVFSSPAYYMPKWRGVGMPGIQQAYCCLSSYALNGRIFYEEADPRTHLAKIRGKGVMMDQLRAGQPRDKMQSIGVVRRIIGKNLSQGTGLWWFLLAGNDTFADDDIMADVKLGASEERLNLMRKRPQTTDVAVFTSADEYATSAGCHAKNLYRHKLLLHTESLPRTGVAYDAYELSDIANPALPGYRVYVFPNAFSPNAAERAAIERLSALGKKVLHISKPISTDTLRQLLSDAGAHVYLDTGDVVFAGRGYVVVHAATPGVKRIKLPGRCDVAEIFGAAKDCCGVTEFENNFKFGQTRVYSIKPSTGKVD